MTKHKMQSVSPNVNITDLENKVIDYWQQNNIFERSISSRPEDKQWTFLDGPPFITGMPHYGTLLSSIPKDIFPRFWTMKGYRVRRVWGWDCHGLPAENKVEDKLGIKRKKDIEQTIGVQTFIDECKNYVKDVSHEWEWYVNHIGRWVDFNNAYKTMDTPYMESVMWVFKQMYDKDYIYKGLRVSLYCPHCETPISNFEVAMDPDNYKEVTEPANTYKYQAKDEPNTFYLAWSTTPWNKLATPALAVNPSLTYVKVKQGDQFYILAENTLKNLTPRPYEIVAKIKGADLVGRSFVPHYDFYPIHEGKRAFVIIPGSFVTADEGTGIVTIAAYGEDDLKAMEAENIEIVTHVDESGILKPEVPNWGGMYYLKVNPLVNADLVSRGLMYREEPHTHTIPTCWRCHTRLIYAPQDAWYVNIAKLKPALFKNNESVNWFPAHFKDGRFRKSIEAAPDWCISRSRYWGSPVPVWECACGERFVPGSLAELSSRVGVEITDLHKPGIDNITIKCAKCGSRSHRVKEVLDSWIEAGSASYAERHWPFDKDLKLADFFPPDFIVEYTGQIRAWFYVLHVIATALYNSPAFKNVVVTGVILGTDGRKMSKNFGNYPDPKEMLNKYGGDALRLYLMGSPVMHGEDVIISESDYHQQLRSILLPLWNVYNFFVNYAKQLNWQIGNIPNSAPHILDRWILSRLSGFTQEITESLESYDTVIAVRAIAEFISDLSQWYVRRSRGRASCLDTLYHVLTAICKVMAPIIPFLTEDIYRNLTGEISVHLTSWPEVGTRDQSLERDMTDVRQLVESGHSARKTAGIRLRQPLASITIPSDLSADLQAVLSDELNVKKIILGTAFALDTTLTPELVAEGTARDLMRDIQGERKKLGLTPADQIKVELPSWPEAWTKEIKSKVNAVSLAQGPLLTVDKI